MNNREQWGSRLGFILAAAGSAVGIGNIWKYPHMAGSNGGAAFTLVYLLCILVVGMTIVIAEFAIGRRTQLSPVGAFEKISSKYQLEMGWFFRSSFSLCYSIFLWCCRWMDNEIYIYIGNRRF